MEGIIKPYVANIWGCIGHLYLKKEAIHFLLFRAEHQNLIINNNSISMQLILLLPSWGMKQQVVVQW